MTSPLLRRTRAIALIGLALAAPGMAQVPPDLGYTTRVSANLIARYARLFGPATPGRLALWMGYAKEQKGAAILQRLDGAHDQDLKVLQGINDAINHGVEWIDDQAHWGQEDYWATPAESIGSAGGDCEDFALAKYYLLKELGVPIERLRITYVRALAQNRTAHMVLAYYRTPDAEPLIMDNADVWVRKASWRSDLEPVYSFNDDEVTLVSGSKGKPAQIRAWLSLQERLLAESRT